MSDLQEQIAKLTPEQLTLLYTQLDQAAPAVSASESIPSRAGKGPCPLSFAQERLWFLDQFEPGLPVYNICSAVHIRGPVNLGALQYALDGLVTRHESLRTVFRSVDGTPMQEVIANRGVSLQVVALDENQASEEQVKLLLRKEARRPFDLSRDLLLRASLVRRRPDEHWLLLVIHHIASDRWSMGVIFRELDELYRANCAGKSPRLPELPIQYPDFADWQRRWLQDGVLEKQVSYWKKRLAGAPSVLDLPTDRPRPSRQSLSGARERLLFSASLTGALRDLSQREGVSLFMTLLAGLQVLLYRYTAQSDICVGTAIANRTRVELEPLIGLFLNTLVLRTDLSGKPNFRQLLHRVREVTLGAFAHQDLPFEKLVDALGPVRSLSYTPLFQVMLILQNSPAGSLQISGASTREVKIDRGTAMFDLTFTIQDAGTQLTGSLEHNTDLFDTETVRRMLGHFQTLLESAVRDPDQPISDLPILTEGERRKLLVEWNDTRENLQQACVHELFEAQAARRPEATALVSGKRELSYGELNRRANQVAHGLQRLGIGPESCVGICVERSPEMVVGLLGILKAGGAYIPLDPSYPQERLAFMVADAGVQVLLTQEHLRAKFSECRARLVCIDSEGNGIRQHSSENCRSGVGPENLAYVIYTSGSTGVPKGVQIFHRSLVNFLASMQVKPGLTSEDALLAVTTASFDIAALELFLPLTVGARVILVSHDTAADGRRLLETLAESGATCMQATPAVWRMLINAGWRGDRNLKVLCGGEALPRDLANELAKRVPSVWNMYGPTETTVWSAVHRVTSATGPVLIGRPIANTELYVLDKHLQPVPVGVVGELHIGGEGLARGYLNRLELSAEKFIPNPFSVQADARLYKTGDLARYRPDGNVEFLGRADDLIKIRGFRVEPGEIEAVLAAHPGVREAAVVLHEQAPGDQRLIAYVVPRAPSQPRPEDLRNFLRRKLPEYMLPGRFEFLASLPLTPAGKVDRRGLPKPGSSRPESGTEYVAPRTKLEKKLAVIWAEVLKLDRVGIHDNFFDLGGHSLLAVRLIAVVERVCAKKLSLVSLFQAPTISDLTALLTAPASPESDSGVIPIQPRGSKPPFFCLGAGLLFRALALRLSPNQPFLGLCTVKSDLQGLPAPFRFEDIAACLVRRMRTVQPRGPYFLGGWCHDGVFAYEVAQQLRAQGEEVALLVMLDVRNPARWHEYSSLEKFSMRLNRRARNTSRYLKNLRKVGLKQGLQDFPDWCRFHLGRFGRTPWAVYYKLLLAIQGRFGDRFREFSRIAFVTIVQYLPKPYSGRVLIIRSGPGNEKDAQDRQKDWQSLVVGRSEVRDVPGGHRGMFLEPSVGVLAGVLESSLLDAQQADSEDDSARMSSVGEEN